MNQDPELSLRGRLVRSLGAMREMLPGSFVERGRKCGKPTCHYADGKNLHTQFLLSVLSGDTTRHYKDLQRPGRDGRGSSAEGADMQGFGGYRGTDLSDQFAPVSPSHGQEG
jgi:hypothetical protein